MVDIIENKVPTDFVGGYILRTNGIEVGELCREARAPEGLIMNLLMFGPYALADSYRLGSPEIVEAACKVFYSKAGIPRTVFWTRLDDTVYKIKKSVEQPESWGDIKAPPSSLTIGMPNYRATKGKKLSSETIAKRIVSTLHNTQHKKKGQTIRLTPARAALAERGISVDTVREKLEVSTNIVYPLLDGDPSPVKNTARLKETKQRISDYLIKDLDLPLDPKAMFKLRKFVWNSETSKFEQPSKKPQKSKPASIGFDPLTLPQRLKKSDLDNITWSPPTTFKPELIIAYEDKGDKPGILTRVKKWFKGD